MNLRLLLVERSKELNLGHCSWETSAAQLCWMAGNPGVQHNSNIQFLFHIRKYFLIITAGVLEWFPRLISASQIRRRGGLACLFPAFGLTPWEGPSGLSPGAGWPLSIPAGETSLTQTILKRIFFSLVVVPQCGLCSFLCWHKAWSGSRRETNRWLNGKWDGSFQRQSWLVPACSTHTALAWEGFLLFGRGVFCLL